MTTLQTVSIAVVAGIISLVLGTTLLPSKASAWHPNGKITKFVMNETTQSASVDANTKEGAVSAKPGDTLLYTITIKNAAQPAENNVNDLAFVEINDTLPAEVELVSNSAQRSIKETIPGTIKPGASVTKQYRVKVIANVEKTFKNTACFEGNSVIKDKKHSGCDDAYTTIKVEKQPKPEQPKPETPKNPSIPAALPSTGPEAAIASLVGVSALGFATTQYQRSKRRLLKTYRK